MKSSASKPVSREEWYNGQKYHADMLKQFSSNMEETKKNAIETAANLIKTTAQTTEMALNMEFLKKDVAEIKQTLKESGQKMEQAVKDLLARDEQYVKKNDFEDHEKRVRDLERATEDNVLVKKIVYGASGIILVAVLSAIIYLVVKK